MNTRESFKPAFQFTNTIRCGLLGLMGALILAPALAQAHPGHELSRAGLSHLMTSFDHLTVLSLVGGTLLVGSVLIQRRFPRLFLRGCGVLTLVATAVLWGVGA